MSKHLLFKRTSFHYLENKIIIRFLMTKVYILCKMIKYINTQ